MYSEKMEDGDCKFHSCAFSLFQKLSATSTTTLYVDTQQANRLCLVLLSTTWHYVFLEWIEMTVMWREPGLSSTILVEPIPSLRGANSGWQCLECMTGLAWILYYQSCGMYNVMYDSLSIYCTDRKRYSTRNKHRSVYLNYWFWTTTSTAILIDV